MNAANIRRLMAEGHGADTIYQIAAGNMSLFEVAFFGHKGKTGERSKLQRVWRGILKQFQHTPRTMEILRQRDTLKATHYAN